MSKLLVHIMVITFATISCVKKPDQMVGPTIGSLDIIADENLKYIIEQEEDIFERNYKYADLRITYETEYEMFRKFVSDSTKAVISTRKLTSEEKEIFEKRNVHPREFAFATGAIAFITNQNSVDTSITFEEMLSYWREGEKGKIFVIENAKSGIVQEVLRNSGAEAIPAHFYAFDTKKAVFDYVVTHDDAIGIVDWSDISDSDNAQANDILNSITLIGISRHVDSIQHGFLKPFQYNLQDNKYPFTRELYFISGTGMADVGLGFASFMTGEIGQKIILKAGLLPKYQTERIIEMGTATDIKVIK